MSWTYTPHLITVTPIVEGLHSSAEDLLQITVQAERMPLDTHCRADNGSDNKKNSLLTYETPRTSWKEVLFQPCGEYYTQSAIFTAHSIACIDLCNWAGNQSQLGIFSSPIPPLQNGFTPLRWGHKKP